MLINSEMQSAINKHRTILRVGESVKYKYENGFVAQVKIITLFRARNGLLYAKCKTGGGKVYFNIDNLSPIV